MKKAILIICLLAGVTTYAQTGSGIGLKGGLNFGATGDLSESIGNLDDATSKLGFHVGAFGKLDFGTIYLRPELVYTRLNSKYDNYGDFNMNKLDMPLLVGLNIIGPVHVFAGPALQYILDTELENVELSDVKDDFTVGFNIGAGLNLSEQLGVDVRYERGFSENEAETIGAEGSERVALDTRPSQLILSLSYKF